MKNRARHDPAKAAGVWVAALTRELEGFHGHLSDISTMLRPVIDEEFRRHCRIGGFQARTVTIRVDDPARVSYFRLRWTEVLRGALNQYHGVRKIVFEFGSGGASL